MSFLTVVQLKNNFGAIAGPRSDKRTRPLSSHSFRIFILPAGHFTVHGLMYRYSVFGYRATSLYEYMYSFFFNGFFLFLCLRVRSRSRK